MINKLAINGGKPTLKALKPYRSIGRNEIKAVNEVMRSGNLSSFFGSWRNGFFGGPKIQELENNWSKKFKTKFSVSFNSNTSGLYASMAAIGISPGDEVLLPCTTMSATAMAPLIYGGIPIFVDIDEDTFCISINDLKKKITKKSKAVIAVNLFGHPAELGELKKICNNHNLFLIEDNAQAPLATENNNLTGTIGDVGIFSLNYHKHIHCGEGGVAVTNNKDLAVRMQLVRNHAEAVVKPAKVDNLTNMIGFNFRMTELSAAVANEQLRKIEKHVDKRIKISETLSEKLSNLKGITVPKIRNKCKHVYYEWAIKFDDKVIGLDRDKFVEALNKQGFPCFSSYLQPLYNLPIFKKKIAIGKDGFPFNLSKDKNIFCPTAENLYSKKFILFEPCAFDVNKESLNKLVEAFKKVYENLDQLN